jgi:RNA polymerase subunit RPABC4/transcription elongation factor Spt4
MTPAIGATEKRIGELMQETNQKLTGFAAEIRHIAGWVWALALLGFLSMQYVFNVVVAHQPDAPPAWARPVLGLSVGLVVAFYLLLVGYVSRDFKLVAGWAWILAATGFVSMQIVFNVVVAREHDAPPAWERTLLGLLVGLILSCYLLLIGYVNRDSGRRGMNRALWTTVSVLVPNGLGIILYFILRQPVIGDCPKCGHSVHQGFNFCPQCNYKLNPSCPQCQRMVSPQDTYCPYCGTSLPEPAVRSGIPQVEVRR